MKLLQNQGLRKYVLPSKETVLEDGTVIKETIVHPMGTIEVKKEKADKLCKEYPEFKVLKDYEVEEKVQIADAILSDNPVDDETELKSEEELVALKEEAKSLGIKGFAVMKKETLINKIAEAKGE